MRKGIWFWLIMFLWLCYGLWYNWSAFRGGDYGIAGGLLFPLLLLILLGYRVFGSPVKD